MLSEALAPPAFCSCLGLSPLLAFRFGIPPILAFLHSFYARPRSSCNSSTYKSSFIHPSIHPWNYRSIDQSCIASFFPILSASISDAFRRRPHPTYSAVRQTSNPTLLIRPAPPPRSFFFPLLLSPLFSCLDCLSPLSISGTPVSLWIWNGILLVYLPLCLFYCLFFYVSSVESRVSYEQWLIPKHCYDVGTQEREKRAVWLELGGGITCHANSDSGPLRQASHSKARDRRGKTGPCFRASFLLDFTF